MNRGSRNPASMLVSTILGSLQAMGWRNSAVSRGIGEGSPTTPNLPQASRNSFYRSGAIREDVLLAAEPGAVGAKTTISPGDMAAKGMTMLEVAAAAASDVRARLTIARFDRRARARRL